MARLSISSSLAGHVLVLAPLPPIIRCRINQMLWRKREEEPFCHSKLSRKYFIVSIHCGLSYNLTWPFILLACADSIVSVPCDRVGAGCVSLDYSLGASSCVEKGRSLSTDVSLGGGGGPAFPPPRPFFYHSIQPIP